MLSDFQRSLLSKRDEVELLAVWASARDLLVIRNLCYQLSGELTSEFLKRAIAEAIYPIQEPLCSPDSQPRS